MCAVPFFPFPSTSCTTELHSKIFPVFWNATQLRQQARGASWKRCIDQNLTRIDQGLEQLSAVAPLYLHVFIIPHVLIIPRLLCIYVYLSGGESRIWEQKVHIQAAFHHPKCLPTDNNVVLYDTYPNNTQKCNNNALTLLC